MPSMRSRAGSVLPEVNPVPVNVTVVVGGAASGSATSSWAPTMSDTAWPACTGGLHVTVKVTVPAASAGVIAWINGAMTSGSAFVVRTSPAALRTTASIRYRPARQFAGFKGESAGGSGGGGAGDGSTTVMAPSIAVAAASVWLVSVRSSMNRTST